MAKSIKLQAVVVPGFNKVMFKVIEQTHKGYYFGNAIDSRKFRASNGITLASNLRPARDTDDKNTIWLQGSDAAKNGNTIVVGAKRFEKIVAAVKEYNRVMAYTAPKPAPKPAANPCAVIVG